MYSKLKVMCMYKILVIEDDEALCTQICERLEKWEFEAVKVQDFKNIVSECIRIKPNLIIMDVTLPYFDGFYWCNKIRDISSVPIIFASSRDSNMDIIMAINMGGDDYVTKPFSIDILIAKITALLRRTYSYGNDSCEVIECNGAVLNLIESTFTYNDKKIELTRNEFKILEVLIKNKAKVVSREKIMRALWEDDNFINDNTLTVNINRLRSRIADIGLNDFIITKKGRGYIIL